MAKPKYKNEDLIEALREVNSIFQKEKLRLDFLEMIINAQIPIYIRPGFSAIVGTIQVNGAPTIRSLIDRLIRINNGEETTDANTSENRKEENSANNKNLG